MDWVLGFARAKKVYDKIIADKLYATPNAKKVILSKYGTTGAFGDFTQAVADLHKDQIQYQYVESHLTDDPDDLFCALGDFALYVAIKGTASTTEITITHIAIYVRDDFEFNDKGVSGAILSQPLGYWNPVAKKLLKKKAEGYYYASNAAFRTYSTNNKNGGDFLIFSDVKEIKLDAPLVIKK